MDWAYVLPHRPDDCGVAMNSNFFPSSHPQDANSGQLGRSIPQPRQTLNIGAALAQGSAARAAFGQEPTLLGDVHCSALRSLKSVHVAKDRLPPRADSVMARPLLVRSALRGT